MKLVILESPYVGDISSNVDYARQSVRHSLSLGEAPIASHLLYTQVGILDDLVPQEREWGIAAGLAWGNVAHATVVYIDRGVSSGMAKGIKAAQSALRPIIFRSIYEPKMRICKSCLVSTILPIDTFCPHCSAQVLP